jgi:hypothetical protein
LIVSLESELVQGQIPFALARKKMLEKGVSVWEAAAKTQIELARTYTWRREQEFATYRKELVQGLQEKLRKVPAIQEC